MHLPLVLLLTHWHGKVLLLLLQLLTHGQPCVRWWCLCVAAAWTSLQQQQRQHCRLLLLLLLSPALPWLPVRY